LNLYAFCGNNPVNFSDPTGLCREQFDPGAYNPWLDPSTYNGVGAAALDGFQAWVDGVIPFSDPLGGRGAYNANDPALQVSQLCGGISRTAATAALNLHVAGQLVPGVTGVERSVVANMWVGALVSESTPAAVSAVYSASQLATTAAGVYDTAVDVKEVADNFRD
jgi:hypothetical protein